MKLLEGCERRTRAHAATDMTYEFVPRKLPEFFTTFGCSGRIKSKQTRFFVR